MLISLEDINNLLSPRTSIIASESNHEPGSGVNVRLVRARICNSRTDERKESPRGVRNFAVQPLCPTICIARPRPHRDFLPWTSSNSRGPAGRPISDFLALSYGNRKSGVKWSIPYLDSPLYFLDSHRWYSNSLLWLIWQFSTFEERVFKMLFTCFWIIFETWLLNNT